MVAEILAALGEAQVTAMATMAMRDMVEEATEMTLILGVDAILVAMINLVATLALADRAVLKLIPMIRTTNESV